MATDRPDPPRSLWHADLSARPVDELSAEERAELSRRYENFMRYVRAGKLAPSPSTGLARRIRKWRP